MAIIKVMDELLANKIAAGEVVERCASVVKELVENSIDASSTEIKVLLKDAGTREIKVVDNGKGMDKDDAVLAFSRHATSKIDDEDDLYRLETLGFRGEALASIAAVSKVDLKTCSSDIGTHVIINGGKILEVSKGDARKGTIITVSELFYNTPARLKHMKSLYTELASITDYMNKLALSHPNIRFILENNDNLILRTDGSGNLLKVIQSIYGNDVVRKMVPVSGENADYEINGYISLPEVHRSSRNNMVTIVNGRVVRNTEINRVINEAYHSYKPDNRYPITVLNITVDPSVIDVNIHPTKMDIKFSKMDTLIELISEMVISKISNRELIPKAFLKEEKIEEKKEKPKYIEQFIKIDSKGSTIEEVEIPEEEIIINNDLDIDLISDDEEYKVEEKLMPEMYPTGLVHGTYIILENEKGMYLMDLHAAKERCNYERFKKAMGEPIIASTSMLFPITIELTSSEYIILKEHLEMLTELKFKVEEFGINSIIIKEHPAWLPTNNLEDSIRTIIDIIIKEKEFSIEKFNEKVATMMSCKHAVRANTHLTMEDMTDLVEDLRNCKNPFNCPHGRPTTIFYSNYDLEKLFKRSGFDTKK
ncbi:MAG: DNA mismatch repair endonuclease MutL [Bacilli bacterium]|nr:DNA mismatch repair endonuclease MutL [Bacilli bacterium]